jgi:hypothetical protein
MPVYRKLVWSTLLLGGVAHADLAKPKELADLAKLEAGSWKCKGHGLDKATDLTGTLSIKLEVDSWWLHATFDGTAGKSPLHVETFTSWFGNSGDTTVPRHWQRTTIANNGWYGAGESTSESKDGKVDIELAGHTPGGAYQLRDHEDASDLKTGLKLTREMTPDHGKTWAPVYVLTCTR